MKQRCAQMLNNWTYNHSSKSRATLETSQKHRKVGRRCDAQSIAANTCGNIQWQRTQLQETSPICKRLQCRRKQPRTIQNVCLAKNMQKNTYSNTVHVFEKKGPRARQQKTYRSEDSPENSKVARRSDMQYLLSARRTLQHDCK